jgi:hypothetical protein
MSTQESSPVSKLDFQTLLADLLTARAESLAQFGATLAGIIDPDHRPFTKQYILRLKQGKDAPTPEIARALLALAAMQDGVSDLQARAMPMTLLVIHEHEPNTIALGKSRGCKLAGCRIRFIPASPAQKFCSQDCRQEYNRRKQHAGQK